MRRALLFALLMVGSSSVAVAGEIQRSRIRGAVIYWVETDGEEVIGTIMLSHNSDRCSEMHPTFSKVNEEFCKARGFKGPKGGTAGHRVGKDFCRENAEVRKRAQKANNFLGAYTKLLGALAGASIPSGFLELDVPDGPNVGFRNFICSDRAQASKGVSPVTPPPPPPKPKKVRDEPGGRAGLIH